MTFEDFRARLPHAEIAEGYGCTESAAIIATSPLGQARPGSVGRPAPGVEVRIERPEVVAFVQLAAGRAVTAAELVAFARQHLSAVKYPREVRIVDTIPLTSVLKTDRERLRAQLVAEAAG